MLRRDFSSATGTILAPIQHDSDDFMMTEKPLTNIEDKMKLIILHFSCPSFGQGVRHRDKTALAQYPLVEFLTLKNYAPSGILIIKLN